MDLSVIIVSFNTKKVLRNSLESLLKNTKQIKYEVIIIDNNSQDGSVRYVKKLKNKNKFVKLIENNKNVGFGIANNQGVRVAKGEYILFLNSDTIVDENVAGEMVKWMKKNKEIGVSSCKLLNKDGSIQGTGGYFPTLLRVFSWMFFWDDLPLLDKLIKPFHPVHARSFFYTGRSLYDKELELDWVTGAFMLVNKKALDEVGLFDEDYFMYTEETDLCYRIKSNGWKIVYTPKWRITHLGGASTLQEFSILSEFKGVKTFFQKHMPSWQLPILSLSLKIGALLRIILFGLLKGDKKGLKIYAKALQIA